MFQVNAGALDATYPAVAADSGNDVFIGWQESSSEIMVAKYDANGATLISQPTASITSTLPPTPTPTPTSATPTETRSPAPAQTVSRQGSGCSIAPNLASSNETTPGEPAGLPLVSLLVGVVLCWIRR